MPPPPAGRGGEVSKDSSSSRRKPRLDMKRTSSAGQALDYDEAPPIRDQDKDCGYSYSRAKSHVSLQNVAIIIVRCRTYITLQPWTIIVRGFD